MGFSADMTISTTASISICVETGNTILDNIPISISNRIKVVVIKLKY